MESDRYVFIYLTGMNTWKIERHFIEVLKNVGRLSQRTS